MRTWIGLNVCVCGIAKMSSGKQQNNLSVREVRWCDAVFALAKLFRINGFTWNVLRDSLTLSTAGYPVVSTQNVTETFRTMAQIVSAVLAFLVRCRRLPSVATAIHLNAKYESTLFMCNFFSPADWHRAQLKLCSLLLRLPIVGTTYKSTQWIYGFTRATLLWLTWDTVMAQAHTCQLSFLRAFLAHFFFRSRLRFMCHTAMNKTNGQQRWQTKSFLVVNKIFCVTLISHKLYVVQCRVTWTSRGWANLLD